MMSSSGRALGARPLFDTVRKKISYSRSIVSPAALETRLWGVLRVL